jgi:hypothetical protein
MVCTDIEEDRKAIELLDLKQFSIDPLPGLAHYRVGHSRQFSRQIRRKSILFKCSQWPVTGDETPQMLDSR